MENVILYFALPHATYVFRKRARMKHHLLGIIPNEIEINFLARGVWAVNIVCFKFKTR